MQEILVGLGALLGLPVIGGTRKKHIRNGTGKLRADSANLRTEDRGPALKAKDGRKPLVILFMGSCMVEVNGIEPSTSALRTPRSPN